MIHQEQRGTGSGQAKIILTGEHAVVYGYPAVALGLHRATTVTLSAVVGPTHLASGDTQGPLTTLLERHLPAKGLRMSIESDIPVGKGMGSSAALAVALVRARAAWNGTHLSEAQTFEQSLTIEQIFHGNPSGLDNTIAAMGGVLRFQKGASPTRLAIPDWSLVILDAGPAPTTRDMLQLVAKGFPANERLLQHIGSLSETIATNLNDEQLVGTCMNENHERLVQLGLSSPALDELVAWATRHGATGAKLSGAGGGGMVIALVSEPERLLKEAEHVGISAFHTRPWVQP